MKTVLHIPLSDIGNHPIKLLLEISRKGLSLFWFTSNPNKIEGLTVYVFDELENMVSAVAEILDKEEISGKSIEKVTVAYNYNESILVPEKFYDADLKSAMLTLQYGEGFDYISASDHVKKLSLWNIYRVPAEIDGTIRKVFPASKIIHSSSIQSAVKNDKDFLKCIVFYDTVKVILFKSGVLQFIQQFNYSSPEDAVYHLLNTCKQHEVNPESIPVRLSGMIVKDSFLFENLYNYFLDIDFEQSTHVFTIAEGMGYLPLHFFNHLTELAACES